MNKTTNFRWEWNRMLFQLSGAAARLLGVWPHSSYSCQLPKGYLFSLNEACWSSYVDSEIISGPLLVLALGPPSCSLDLWHSWPHCGPCIPLQRERTREGLWCTAANVIEVRVWLHSLTDLHWPSVEGQWEGNNEALAKPSGLLVPLSAVIFLMSREQKTSLLPKFPCSILRKKSKNALQISLQVKGTSLNQIYSLGAGLGWGSGALTQCSPRGYPRTWKRGFCSAKLHSDHLAKPRGLGTGREPHEILTWAVLHGVGVGAGIDHQRCRF